MSWLSQNQKQAKSQTQLDKQEEIKIQLLKNQIDTMFDVFKNVINYLKTDKPSQSLLLTLNDSAVSLLKLLGSTCKEHIDNFEKNILIVSYGHFDLKKKELGTDSRIIKHWLNYAECALLGKKLNQIKISKITVDSAHKNMEKGGLKGFMNKYIGANHYSQEIINDAEINREKYNKQNQVSIINTQKKYQKRQEMVKCPDQNKMYDIVGGGQNMQLCILCIYVMNTYELYIYI